MEQQAISSDLIRGHIDTIILHTLLDGDKFAQQISDAVELKSDKKYQINQATLYSSLKRLENSSYVKSYWNDGGDGRRKFFKITDNGKTYVEQNLMSWTYSRAIIDKLMNVQPEERIVERIVTVPVQETNNIVVQPQIKTETEKELVLEPKRDFTLSDIKDDSPIAKTILIEKEPIKEEKVIPDTLIAQPIVNKEQKTEEDVKEINFRNILNGLIKASAETIQKEPEKKQIEEISHEKNRDPEDKKVKFDDVISTEYNAKSAVIGKIDFSDLSVKATNEGYKVRISSKNSAKPKGTLYQNKLEFFSILTIFILAQFELLIFGLYFGLKVFPIASIIVTSCCFLIAPVIFGVKFAKSPRKVLTKPLRGDKILTCAIIVFNLILITFALNFLINVDFADKPNLIRFFYAPILLFLDSLLYFVVEFLFSKTNLCKIKRK